MSDADRGRKNVAALETVIKLAAFSGAPIQPLDGWCTLAPIKPTGGYWYFGFACPRCKRVVPMLRDFADGHLGKPFKGFGINATCIFCEYPIRCASEGIESAQWPLEPGQTPPKSEYALNPKPKYTEDPEYGPLIGPLHHYTSLHALLAIFESKALWATNALYLNDSSESELGLNRMREVAREARVAAEGIDARFIDHFLRWLDSRPFDRVGVYVLCFSQSRDQLSQWRGYTEHGRGVCLSIDSKELVQRMQALGWTVQNCRYTVPSQLAWAEAIVRRLRREAAIKHTGVESEEGHGFDAVLKETLPDILQVAATIKNDAFSEEREVRLISPLISIDDARVRYRVGKSALIPYVEFDLAGGQTGLSISELMIGPSPMQELTQSALQGAIAKYAIRSSDAVSRSRIPYREL